MFKPCGAKVFSLQIHLSTWYLRAAAVFILFYNVVTLRLSFISRFSRCFESCYCLATIDVLAIFRKALWKLFSCISNIQDFVLWTLCSVIDFSFEVIYPLFSSFIGLLIWVHLGPFWAHIGSFWMYLGSFEFV